jgi:hypothetical protein
LLRHGSWFWGVFWGFCSQLVLGFEPVNEP